jgi:iron-sulfur cluster assembly accessory protein
VGQGHEHRQGDGDQEQPDRRGAVAAAGQDPLLGARRGRDQGRDPRLPAEARHPPLRGEHPAYARTRSQHERRRARRRLRQRERRRHRAARRRTPLDRDPRRAAEGDARAARPRGTPHAAIRLGIRGGGCTGYSYLFEFDDREPRASDHVLVKDGVRWWSTPRACCWLKGTEVDFETGMRGHGFKFNNPNVKGDCGCGESVSSEPARHDARARPRPLMPFRTASAGTATDADYFGLLGLERRWRLDRARSSAATSSAARRAPGRLHRDQDSGRSGRRWSAAPAQPGVPVLRDPVLRAEYLVKLGGHRPATAATRDRRAASRAFLIEMIELRERSPRATSRARDLSRGRATSEMAARRQGAAGRAGRQRHWPPVSWPSACSSRCASSTEVEASDVAPTT